MPALPPIDPEEDGGVWVVIVAIFILVAFSIAFPNFPAH